MISPIPLQELSIQISVSYEPGTVASLGAHNITGQALLLRRRTK